jgi:hypothetical protein
MQYTSTLIVGRDHNGYGNGRYSAELCGRQLFYLKSFRTYGENRTSFMKRFQCSAVSKFQTGTQITQPKSPCRAAAYSCNERRIQRRAKTKALRRTWNCNWNAGNGQPYILCNGLVVHIDGEFGNSSKIGSVLREFLRLVSRWSSKKTE